jgi:hypothetical protein
MQSGFAICPQVLRPSTFAKALGSGIDAGFPWIKTIFLPKASFSDYQRSTLSMPDLRQFIKSGAFKLTEQGQRRKRIDRRLSLFAGTIERRRLQFL